MYKILNIIYIMQVICPCAKGLSTKYTYLRAIVMERVYGCHGCTNTLAEHFDV